MRRAAVVAALAFAVSAPIATPAQAVTTAAVTIDQPNTGLGARVLVQGTGWPGRALVRIELCGNNALDDSADCDLATSTAAGVGSNGDFSMLLTITKPPTPCPCVVRVSNAVGAIPAVRMPIKIVGVPFATPHSRVPVDEDPLHIEDAHVSGNGSWQSWFGASTTRDLVITLHNTASYTITEVPLTITSGKGSSPTAFIPSPTIGPLAPGERRTMRIPVTLDAFSWGKYKLSGSVTGFGPSAEFSTSTSTYWYGWIVVAFLLANVILWRTIRRVAAWRERRRVVVINDVAELPSPVDESEPAVM